MEINCLVAPTMDTPEHIALAERIGYQRAWVYDSPTIYADAALTLGFAAQRTTTIRLGISVITEHLRHLVVNASLVAQLSTDYGWEGRPGRKHVWALLPSGRAEPSQRSAGRLPEPRSPRAHEGD